MPEISSAREWGGSRWVLAPPTIEEDTIIKVRDTYCLPCLSLISSFSVFFFF